MTACWSLCSLIRWSAASLTLFGMLILNAAPARPAEPSRPETGAIESRKVSIQVSNTPLRQVLDSLAENTGARFTIRGDVGNPPVSLRAQDVTLGEALRALMEAAPMRLNAMRQPGGAWLIERALEVSEPLTYFKVPLQFADAAELAARLDRGTLPVGIVSFTTIAADNSLLFRGTTEALDELREGVRLWDVPRRSFLVAASVTAPGAGGRGVQIQSLARTVNNKEITIEETGALQGSEARLKVRVLPVLMGDGTVRCETDWEVSIPLALGKSGRVRLVKRLNSTTRINQGEAAVVASVGLAPWGGQGELRFWLRVAEADPAPHAPARGAGR